MTNQLTELLQRLSEIEPEVCDLSPSGIFTIGEYCFWADESDVFTAYHKPAWDRLTDESQAGRLLYEGPPALAWLRDAVERAIEARGWTLAATIAAGISKTATIGTFDRGTIGSGYSKDDLAHALLAAFVAAVGAVKEGER